MVLLAVVLTLLFRNLRRVLEGVDATASQEDEEAEVLLLQVFADLVDDLVSAFLGVVGNVRLKLHRVLEDVLAVGVRELEFVVVGEEGHLAGVLHQGGVWRWALGYL